MKKLLKIVFIGMMFFIAMQHSFAAETLAVCEYVAPLQNDTTLPFSITIYDDGSLSYNPNHGFSVPATSMLLVYNLDEGTYFEKLYSNGELGKCPDLSLCIASGVAYHVQEQSYCSSTGTNGYLMKGTLKNVSDTPEKEDLSETLCSNRKMSIRTRGDIYFTFGLDENGNKIWSIKSTDGTSSASTPYNMEITIGPSIFAIDESLYNVLWEGNNCDTTPLYLKNPYSDQIKYIVVDEMPDPSENGTVDDWDGFEKANDEDDDDPSGGSDEPQYEDPDYKVDGDTTVADICNMPEYRKPMKIVGIVINFAKIIVPIIIIGFGVMDLYKAITSSKDDGIKKAVKSIVIRVIAGVAIFLLPGLIQFVLNWVNEWSDYENSWCCCTDCLLNPDCDTSACNSDSCRIEGMN